MLVSGHNELDPFAMVKHPVHHPHQHHDTNIGIEPGIEYQGLGWLGRVSGRRRYTLHDGLKHLFDSESGLGRYHQHVRRIETDDILDLLRHPVRIRRGEIDLVHDGNQLEIRVHCEIGVRKGLCLDPLRRIDDQESTFTGGERTRNLVRKIDVAGGVDQIEDVLLTVGRMKRHASRLCLDRDAPLSLEIHVVEELILHFSLGQCVGRFEQSIGERALAVIDMRNDAEIANPCGIKRHPETSCRADSSTLESNDAGASGPER